MIRTKIELFAFILNVRLDACFYFALTYDCISTIFKQTSYVFFWKKYWASDENRKYSDLT